MCENTYEEMVKRYVAQKEAVARRLGESESPKPSRDKEIHLSRTSGLLGRRERNRRIFAR